MKGDGKDVLPVDGKGDAEGDRMGVPGDSCKNACEVRLLPALDAVPGFAYISRSFARSRGDDVRSTCSNGSARPICAIRRKPCSFLITFSTWQSFKVGSTGLNVRKPDQPATAVD